MMQFVTLRQQQEETDGMVTVEQHWYLVEDKTRVVPESDPDGRWLWASPGTSVPLRDALRLGAVQLEQEDAAVAEDPKPEPEPEKAPEPEEKMVKPAANKARKAGAAKAEDK